LKEHSSNVEHLLIDVMTWLSFVNTCIFSLHNLYCVRAVNLACEDSP
jgi:hypothetical protein